MEGQTSSQAVNVTSHNCSMTHNFRSFKKGDKLTSKLTHKIPAAKVRRSSLCCKIVELHRGEISATNCPGRGAEFAVATPASAADASG
jgi:hypothetical protein